MPYSFKVGDQSPDTISQLLESFWIFVKFSVDAQGLTTITGGHFAVYFSQSSDAPQIGKLEFTKRETYQISDGTQSFSLKKADLEKSIKYQFSNEVAELHLFTFATQQCLPEEWFNDTDYKPPFRVPEENKDRSAFIKQNLNFGNFQQRYVYSISIEESSNGTEKLLVALPFLNSSILKQILDAGRISVGGQRIPEIIFEHEKNDQQKEWSYFQNTHLPLNGLTQGFVMVTQGVFKSMPFNLNVDQWMAYTNTNMLVQPLVELAHQATSLVRNIENVDVNSANSVYPHSPDGPIEILYIRDLDSKARLVL